jgi:heme-degrading monooxygenase HmoA
MIDRVWHGWAAQQNADAYENFLRATFLPAIHRIAGYHGARVLRRDRDDEVEFVTITSFESIEAIRAFAGEDWEAAHVAPTGRQLLSRFDLRCAHYGVVIRDVE